VKRHDQRGQRRRRDAEVAQQIDGLATRLQRER
jgi:hypothetical protein